mgnify:CR=1 FL=1
MSTRLLPKPSRNSVNRDHSACKASPLRRYLGEPRSTYNQDCQPISDSNKRLKRLIVTEDVGPFKVTGLKPAVRRLRSALEEVKTRFPELYDQLGTAGMLCCRYVRGSRTAISNHSWGTAIDFTIGGKLDERGNNKVQAGLFDLYSVLKKYGFYWGVSFGTEDAMHFELSDETIREMAKQGEFR